MASLGESLLPRAAALRGKVAPWSPRAGFAAAMDLASLPGRAYASLGRPEAEAYSDALARTGPTLGEYGTPLYQAGGDEFSETVLRDPTLLPSIGASLVARQLGRAGKALVEGASAAGAAGADQYSQSGAVSPLGMMLAAGLGAAPQAMPRAPGARAAMVDHPTLRRYGLNPEDGITLYHGSPRSFDKFDLSKAGSQRAMTEGWGAYFTADKNNAKAFGKNVINLNLTADDLQRVVDIEAPMSAQTPFVRDALKGLSKDVQNPDDVMSMIQTMARDPLYKSYFGGEIGKALWDYDRMRELILSDKYIDSPAGRILKNQFLPQDISGSTLIKRAVGAMSGSSQKANKWLNSYGVIGYSVPSSMDILAKNKNTANAVIFDQDILSRFDGYSNPAPRAAAPLQALGSRLMAGAQQAALRKYLVGDGEQGDTYYTRKR